MAIFKKQVKTTEVKPVVKEEIKITEEEKQIEEPKKEEAKVEVQVEEVKEEKKEASKGIKKGAKIVANGRCFGSENLECPLKAVRNYETKIIEISDNSVLIDEGWISKENIK